MIVKRKVERHHNTNMSITLEDQRTKGKTLLGTSHWLEQNGGIETLIGWAVNRGRPPAYGRTRHRPGHEVGQGVKKVENLA